jgi:hypothetical protein
MTIILDLGRLYISPTEVIRQGDRLYMQHPMFPVYMDHEVSASSNVLYENEDLYEDGDCMTIYIRTWVMRLMSDRAYAYAYGKLYLYGLWPSR